MHTMNGGCHCGNIRVALELTRAPETYNPRACDCDFCLKHNAAYVSDPQGCLDFRIKDERRCGKYRQGNGIAEFLLCTDCGVLAGVLYRNDGQLFAAVNARVIDGGKAFGTQKPVSPKSLSANEKIQRWYDTWFSSVSIGAA